MFSKNPAIGALIVLFSCSAFADNLLEKGIDIHNDMMDSMSSLHKRPSTSHHQGLNNDDCPGAISRPFGDNGLSSGYGSTHCYTTEFDGGNVQTYFKSSPNGSYSSGFSWTFE
ncbi:hypothetical protein [Vibrio sinaloensis]|uniref:hypothetical protein n=1 Tax=Photobacterium sp. (strain ATCC 43367) TaxID=379097 RepID=UPI0022AFABE4|nr:hypothetical protein [Vibrio sinaloensis]MCZ4293092.1 hypothetical protein [Vibrio sinaloensis]